MLLLLCVALKRSCQRSHRLFDVPDDYFTSASMIVACGICICIIERVAQLNRQFVDVDMNHSRGLMGWHFVVFRRNVALQLDVVTY